jgi:carbon monoxide dehydrogenase subunit G
MPSATFTHTAPLATDIDASWIKLQSEDTWAGIGPLSSVSDATHAADGTLTSFKWAADLGGKRYPGTARTTEAVAPDRFVLEMDTSEIAGTVTAELTPTGSTSQVTVTIAMRTKGMLSAMFFPAIKQALASGFPQQVNDLAASF